MTGSAKRKGDIAERECAALLSDLLGVPARRAFGAGRGDDCGDLVGIPETTISVANYKDIARALREKLPDCVAQQERAGASFGAMFVRRRGGGYIVVMTPEQWATMWREAI